MEFAVQLEVRVGGAWREVIRYDTAHGLAQGDRYNPKGEAKKDGLKLGYDEALSRAERDIKGNWAIYRDRFLKGGFP